MYTKRLGQARIGAASIAGPSAWPLKSWVLISVDLCQCPGENNTRESPGPNSGIPTGKVRQSNVNSSDLCEPTQDQKGTRQRTLTNERLQRRKIQWLLSQGECSNATFLLPQMRMRAKKQIRGLYYSN